MNSTFKPSNRVRIKSGEHEGLVGIIDEIDAEYEMALVNISGAVNDEPFTLNDWFNLSELDQA